MTLPTLNELPSYEVKIPSTGKVVKFRPFLVKEEKVLMNAFESKDDPKVGMKAIIDTLVACDVSGGLGDVSDLTIYDAQYLFAKVRARSIGESSEMTIPCKKCDFSNDVEINVDTVETEVKPAKKTIKLTDSTSVEIGHPKYVTTMNDDIVMDGDVASEAMINLVASNIRSVKTATERFDFSEYSVDDRKEFVESMTTDQFRVCWEFLDDAPKMTIPVKFICMSCAETNEFEISEQTDFF